MTLAMAMPSTTGAALGEMRDPHTQPCPEWMSAEQGHPDGRSVASSKSPPGLPPSSR
jgi:hypothetical protein